MTKGLRHNLTNEELAAKARDNLDAGDYWMLVGEDQVTLTSQSNGKAPTGTVTIPKKEFNRLIRWYQRY